MRDSDLTCFVAVDFVDDPNVCGHWYWYICDDDSVEVGDQAEAPLGHHNRHQIGVVCDIVWETKENWLKIPLYMMKKITKIYHKRGIDYVQDC